MCFSLCQDCWSASQDAATSPSHDVWGPCLTSPRGSSKASCLTSWPQWVTRSELSNMLVSGLILPETEHVSFRDMSVLTQMSPYSSTRPTPGSSSFALFTSVGRSPPSDSSGSLSKYYSFKEGVERVGIRQEMNADKKHVAVTLEIHLEQHQCAHLRCLGNMLSTRCKSFCQSWYSESKKRMLLWFLCCRSRVHAPNPRWKAETKKKRAALHPRSRQRQALSSFMIQAACCLYTNSWRKTMCKGVRPKQAPEVAFS